MTEKLIFDFSAEKNQKLIEQRNVSFEEIIAAINDGGLLDVLEHPNKEKYWHQKQYIVQLTDYVYIVPFVEEGRGRIFLKTIIPSRKAKKQYFKHEVNENETEGA